MIKVILKTYNGNYVQANDSCTNYQINATLDGVARTAVFTIIPLDGRMTDSIASGDQVNLQTCHGRYAKALEGGGGPLNGEAILPHIWETFTIEKLAGEGRIVQGDRVSLRTYNNRNYLMALNGGGGEVTASSLNRREFETFVIEFWNSMPVHIKSHDGHFIAAEDGGGREINANRSIPDIWETFVLVNRTRPLGLVDGDAVFLQVWDGRFVMAEGGGGGNLTANRQIAKSWETFTIKKAGGGEISLSDNVLFQTQNGVNYVIADGGGNANVDANSRNTREFETFQLSPVKRSISEVYRLFSSALGALIGPIYPERLSGGRGSYQLFANGIIIEDHIWGAFELHGENYRKFIDLSTIRPGTPDFLEEQLRILGFPRSSGRGDNSNYFERGLIFSKPDPDPVLTVVYGEFYEVLQGSKALGYPRLDRQPIGDGLGTYQLFENGKIYYTPATCAHSIYGDVWRLWLNWTNNLDHDPDRSSPAFRDPLNSFSRSILTVNPALGYPIDEEHDAPGGGRIQQFEFGSIEWERTGTPQLRVFAQNMALLPEVTLGDLRIGFYKGAEKDRAIQSLINHLRANQYDIVGLSEVWDVVTLQKRPIIDALRDIYPYNLTGPDEADLEADGGLLFLSRYPIIDHHKTIFRQYAGEETVTNKGVLHARIQLPGLDNGYDFYLSHDQNPDAGGHEAARGIVNQQLLHIINFVGAYGSPERPALLMGDLNTNALVVSLYTDFRRRLNFPQDLWLTSGDGSPGVTLSNVSAFEREHTALTVDDPVRREGQRLDYFLSWPGLRYDPQFRQTHVMILQSSVLADGRGRDLSDHYGLLTEMAEMRMYTVEVRRPITRVQMEMVGFRCLEVTQGFSDATKRSNSDEPFFELRCRTASGAEQLTRSPTFSDVDNGEIRTFSGRIITVGDPGEYLDLFVGGVEVDDWPDSDDSLGTSSIRLSRQELLRIWGGSITRVMPLLTGDDSQYAVTVRISVS